MKKCIVLGAVAGIASGAFGQSASLSIVASQTVVDSTVTTSITLAVYGDSDLGTHITAAAFGLSATGGAGVVDDIAYDSISFGHEAFEEDLGHVGDGNYAGVLVKQAVFMPFIPPDPTSALGNGPVLLAYFNVSIVAGSFGVIDWTLVGVPDLSLWPLEAFDVTANPNANPPGEALPFINPDFGSASVNVIPAPSGLGLLGLGGLVAGRRRR